MTVMTRPAPEWAVRALSGVFDPCCREKGISVVDMGLLRSVETTGGHARVELLLTSGWCPFAARVLTDVEDAITRAARRRLVRGRGRLGRGVDDRPALGVRHPQAPLPARPVAVPDRDAYLAAHSPRGGQP